MRWTTVKKLADWGKRLDDDIPTEIPKPYTTPPGFKPPTIGEQWRYAVMKHPYYRYGYALAILVGVIGYGIAREQKDHAKDSHAAQTKQNSAPSPTKS